MLGTNFNYRLIFLAGAIPALICAFEQSREARFLIFSGAVIALLWAVRLPDALYQVSESVTRGGIPEEARI